MKHLLLLPVLLLSVTPGLAAEGTTESALGLKDDRLSYDVKRSTKPTTYAYDCLISDPMAMMALYSHKGELAALQMAPGEVTTSEENRLGDALCESQREQMVFVSEGPRLQALKVMLQNLLDARPENHRDLHYSIHLVENSAVNATTFGGHIYIYTGIVDFCETESELACIIAHEIGHNEHGHIHRNLKRKKIAGNLPAIATLMKEIATMSFNQFNELECDIYGADIAYAAGYNPRAGAEFWRKMAEASKSRNSHFEKLFRTHPYSSDRYDCLSQHLETHYKL